ncbi:MAG: zinc metalloprotease HtpX [Thermodesulfobacteriota bacterium]|nr:zinc metalloprotease HtpX [Thermodesulfobacteriota bacterium]
MTNQVKTVFLLGTLTGLIMLIGKFFGGNSGMVVAFFFATLMNFSSYWFSDKIVLKMYKAKEVTPQQAPHLFSMVSNLTQSAGLPMPRLYIIDSQSPNAFATGRNPENSAVAVTEGLMSILNSDELEGVLAHELSHIKNRDILIGSIAATLAGVIMMLATMARFAAIFGGFGGNDDDDDSGGFFGLIVLAIIAPLAATIIQFTISRSREYLADASGARIAGTSTGLAKALEKLHHSSKRIPVKSNPATAHMLIVNPLSGRAFLNLFSTHPPIEERVKRLLKMR